MGKFGLAWSGATVPPLKKIAIYSAQKIAVVLDWLTLSQTNMGVSGKVQNHYRNIWEKSLKNIFFKNCNTCTTVCIVIKIVISL